MKIGDLADLCDCKVATIRYYESQGLLDPLSRTGSNYRSYDSVQAERLGFILACRALDLPIDKIRALLEARDQPSMPCEPVLALIDTHLADIESRSFALEQLKQRLQSIRGNCSGGVRTGDCAVMASIGKSGCCSVP